MDPTQSPTTSATPVKSLIPKKRGRKAIIPTETMEYSTIKDTVVQTLATLQSSKNH